MIKILIVNDSKFERIIMHDLIETLGFDVTATDEYHYLQKLETYSPDVLIVNLTMNNITGDQLILKIKEQRPFVKCILSSCSPINLKDYSENQIDGVFCTPINPTKMKRILDHITVKNFSYCHGCGHKLPDNITQLAFCPFCGEKTSKDNYA